MTTEKTKKNEKKFSCSHCDFVTCKKTDFNRHNLTQKHKNNVLTTDDNEKNEKKYKCEFCEKKYKDRAGLWRHKKTCIENNNTSNDSLNNELISNEIISSELINKFDLYDKDISSKDLIMMLVKQNSELLEVLKNGTHNTNSHNTNSNNKTFNLQFFLNETCKDAMNIMDFVESIQLQLSDLERVGKVGYVEGISDIITSNLKALDITQRPIHCTDKKRETIYIKDEDKWEKEDDNKKTLRKAIKRVAFKNQRLLPKFKEAHPDCLKSSSPYSDQYNKIIIESLGGSGDNDIEKEDKIIRKISTVTTIDKI
jgi:hypothetical protein